MPIRMIPANYHGHLQRLPSILHQPAQHWSAAISSAATRQDQATPMPHPRGGEIYDRVEGRITGVLMLGWIPVSILVGDAEQIVSKRDESRGW